MTAHQHAGTYLPSDEEPWHLGTPLWWWVRTCERPISHCFSRASRSRADLISASSLLG